MDAQDLFRLASGEVENESELQTLDAATLARWTGGKKRSAFACEPQSRLHELSKRARRAAAFAGGKAASASKPSPPADWLECLRLVHGMRPAHGREMKKIVEHAAELAERAGADPSVLERLAECTSEPVFHNDDAGLCRIKALRLLEEHGGIDDLLSEASRCYLDAVDEQLPTSSFAADEPHMPDGAMTLQSLVAAGAISAGELVLDGPDGRTRAQLRGDGVIEWNGVEFTDVEQFVAAAREAHGLRAPRAAQAKKALERIIHVTTGRRLSTFWPTQSPEHDEHTSMATADAIDASKRRNTQRADHLNEVNKATPTPPQAPRKRDRSSTVNRKRNAPPSLALVNDSQQHYNNKRRVNENVQSALAPAATPATAETGASSTETPLSEYWKDKVSDERAAPSVWDDGFFTDASDDEPANEVADDYEDAAAICDALTAQRSSRRQTSRRREALLRVRGIVDGLASNRLDPHALVGCELYDDAELAESSTSRDGAAALAVATDEPAEATAQPFSLVVHPDVGFLCDLHAHLAEAEIIGLLGGRWDAGHRRMHVQAPFPCRATPREDDGATDVEMDPVSELQVREIIRRHDMDVVGWYHSHPKFAAEPSVTDIDNQRNYQRLFHDTRSGIAPFIGLIVGTYDAASQTPNSVFRYFHVAPPPDTIHKEATKPTPQLVGFVENCEPTAKARSTVEQTDATIPTATDDTDTDVAEASRGFSVDSPAEHADPPPQRPRAARRSLRRDDMSQRRVSPTPTMIPMALRAKVRSYRRRADETTRRAKRDAGPPPPPFDSDKPAALPFGFANRACGFGCLCCPPGEQMSSVDVGPPRGEAGGGRHLRPSRLLDEASALAIVGSPRHKHASLDSTPEHTSVNAPDDGDVPNPEEGDPKVRSRDQVVEELCRRVKARLEKVKAEPADVDAAWSTLDHRYDQTQLSCVVHTVRQLCRYYGRHDRRVELSSQWRKDFSKWDKVLCSLALWTLKMAVDPDDRINFLADIFIYMQACWRNRPKRPKRTPQPRRR